MKKELDIIKAYETTEKFDQKDMQSVLAFFWLAICLDYFYFYQKDKFTKENLEIFERRRYQVMYQSLRILNNYRFNDFLEKESAEKKSNFELNNLVDLQNFSKTKNYNFADMYYPKQKIIILERWMRAVFPVSTVYLSEECSGLVLHNFKKIIEECGFDINNNNTLNTSASVKTYDELLVKLYNKMIYFDNFQFSTSKDEDFEISVELELDNLQK